MSNLAKSAIPPLEEDEINKLIETHKNIVKFLSRKYRFLDTELEEIEGWGYVGLVKALKEYEVDRTRDFTHMVFDSVKIEIFRAYGRSKQPKSQMSLQTSMWEGKEGSSIALEEFLIDENHLSFTETEIKAMVNEAIFEESEKFKVVIKEYLFSDKNNQEIAKQVGWSESIVRRTQKRGQALIKNYLFNNDIILEHNMNPDEKRKKELHIINHNKIQPTDYGKIKYISKHFPYLTLTDISNLMNTSTYAVHQLLDYPTVTYIQSPPDDSIKNKVLAYCKKKYPERLAGKVFVTKYKQNKKDKAVI